MTKVGRNDPCPCGSGKKFKHCHGKAGAHPLGLVATESVARRSPGWDDEDEIVDDLPEQLGPAGTAKLLDGLGIATPQQADAFLDALTHGKPLEPFLRPSLHEQARQIMRETWRAKGRRRIDLAHKALRVDPECVEAYLLLADEEASTDDAKLRRYDQALEAAERLLGGLPYAPPGSDAWMSTEGQAYLTARYERANHFADIGLHAEAIESFEHLLLLDPVDVNEVYRSLLASHLITAQYARAEAVLVEHADEVDCHWKYCRALCAFGLEGDSPDARMLLRDALADLPLIAEWLLVAPQGRQEFDASRQGLEYSANWYTFMYAAAWQAVPGALEWLRASPAQPDGGAVDLTAYRLFLDDDEAEDQHRPFCVACHGRTRHLMTHIVVRFEQAERVSTLRTVWLCDTCAVAMLHQRGLAYGLAAIAEFSDGDADIFGRPYRVMGTLDELDSPGVWDWTVPTDWPDERIPPFRGCVSLEGSAWVERAMPTLPLLRPGMFKKGFG